MYKVFFKESSFLLTDDRNLIKKSEDIHIFTNVQEMRTLVYDNIEQKHSFNIIIYHTNAETLFTHFKSLFTFVHAAGGAVIDQNSVLAIMRMGMLDLPKGHVELNEEIPDCAIREVEEECGVKDIEIVTPLPSTYHIYPYQNEWRLKQSHWFEMRAKNINHIQPQTEEGIEEVFWLDISAIPSCLAKIFPSLIPIFEWIYQNRAIN
ncbi:MAG: NUDIX hydrolase [Marinifilaceae bacterium]